MAPPSKRPPSEADHGAESGARRSTVDMNRDMNSRAPTLEVAMSAGIIVWSKMLLTAVATVCGASNLLRGCTSHQFHGNLARKIRALYLAQPF